jgi:ParB/RepB/Spo0J family partition protein
MQATTKSKAGKGLAAILSDAPVSNGQPSLVFIELSQIMPNSLNPRKEFAEADLNDLADSIKKLGVIQAITIRPARSRGTYELICGERRYKAAIIAGLITIPAVIRDISDAEAMELMITENLQRKDVHPLEEANAIQYMLDKMGYTITDVAAKIGKDERFAIRRLQLTKLIHELKDIFVKNQLGIGHAELLSRINDQHQLLWFKDKFAAAYNPGQGTIPDLKHWLKNKTENKLAGAPFKTDVPYEGKQYVCARCTVCPMNSAYNNSLFPDTAEEAICHDANCYEAKCNADFAGRLQAAIDDPDVVLINDSYGDDKFQKKLTADGHLVLSGWDSFEKITKPDKKSWQYQGKTPEDHQALYAAAIEQWKKKTATSKKGFRIGGSERGTYVPIVIKDKKISSQLEVNSPAAARKAFVADVEEKRKRGRELDAEKIMKRQVDVIRELPHLKAIDPKLNELTPIEYNALLCIAWQKCGYDVQRMIKKHFAIPDSYGEEKKIYAALMTAPDNIKTFIVRNAIFTNFNSINPTYINGAVIPALSESWTPDSFQQIKTEQAGVRERREAKLDQKIKDFDKNFLTEMA